MIFGDDFLGGSALMTAVRAMAFELNIAVKRDPVEQASHLEGGTSYGASCAVTVVEVTGKLSRETSVGLTQSLAEIVATAPSSVVVRFVGDVLVSPNDCGSIKTVAAWVKSRRRDGCNLYVEVLEAGARDVFLRVEDMKNVMLPFGADASVPRRIIGEPPLTGDR